MADYKMLIGGRWVEAASGERFTSISPATGEPVGTAPRGGAEDVYRAVREAKRAFEAWRRTDADERGRILLKIAGRLRERSEDLARLLAVESGHYIGKARALVEGTAKVFEFHAGLADKVRGDVIPVPGERISFTRLEPLGVTAHIVPWNYPLFVMARSCAPALALGNTVVVKPSEETPLVTLELARMIQEAGVPDGVFNVVTGYGPEAGAPLASHPDVEGITFTGSVETGRKVMQMAAGHVAKVCLELGGKTPLIVFPDADLGQALEAALQGILSRAGQICIATSRLLLHREVHDRFVDELAERMREVKVGDPLDEETQMGPIVSQRQLDKIVRYVRIGTEEGAKLVAGGRRPDDPALQKGFYYLPTLLAEVDPGMRVAQDEIFGPVLCVIPWEDEGEMIGMANGVRYGLAASIWTRNIKKALRVAGELEAGAVFVNDWIAEYVQAPHGGYKKSGILRENGLECIVNYTRVKNTVVQLGERLEETWFEAPL
ncbi:MAG TPA: aldehyde dehydrogenase [Candidatus Latescibacteria bacterium]|nr:aldehyde dehydrogenase [Candidatus Latescibacterota bacterium]